MNLNLVMIFLDIDGNDNLNNNDTDGITFFNLNSVTTDVKSTISQ